MVKETPFPTIRGNKHKRYDITDCLSLTPDPQPHFRSFPFKLIKEAGHTLAPIILLSSMLGAVHTLSPNPDSLKPEVTSNKQTSKGWYKATEQILINTKIDPTNPRNKIVGTYSRTQLVYCFIYESPVGDTCAITSGKDSEIIGYTPIQHLQPSGGN